MKQRANARLMHRSKFGCYCRDKSAINAASITEIIARSVVLPGGEALQ
jgi:hypothetical protein